VQRVQSIAFKTASAGAVLSSVCCESRRGEEGWPSSTANEVSRYQTRLLRLVGYLLASASHFFMNDVFAAPASDFPSLPVALLAHAADTLPLLPASHFWTNEVLAESDIILKFSWIEPSSNVRWAEVLPLTRGGGARTRQSSRWRDINL
jgi:hypothetical protein